jgi:hypothetical protein
VGGLHTGVQFLPGCQDGPWEVSTSITTALNIATS